MSAQQQDRDQLQLLGIFHIAYGAFAGIAGLLTFAYMCVLALEETVDSDAVAGGIVFVVGVFICALFLLKGLVMLGSGYGLLQHKWRGLTYVGAGLACLNIPMGTALAVFTFIVLDRASVRALYTGAPVVVPFTPAPARAPRTPKRDTPPTTRPDAMRFRVA